MGTPEGFELNATEQAALDALVPPDQQTGDVGADLTAAARESWARRGRNTELGGAVLGALYRHTRSWRTVGYVTGIPWVTARRWATPPEQADADRPAENGDENGGGK
jgi:hypothetical protein